MKSILLSIKPKYVELIANGEKTIEVRKSAPKEVPLKCYIYETQGKTETPWIDEDGHFIYKGRGQVIGEFICNSVDEYPYDYCDGVDIDDDTILETAIDREDINIYAKGKTLYGWHISDLKIYDTPKELSEFKKTKERIAKTCGMQARNGLCCAIDHEELCDNIKCCFKTPCPPQSWQYIEDLGEEK